MDPEDKNLELASSAAPRSFASAQDDIASVQQNFIALSPCWIEITAHLGQVNSVTTPFTSERA